MGSDPIGFNPSPASVSPTKTGRAASGSESPKPQGTTNLPTDGLTLSAAPGPSSSLEDLVAKAKEAMVQGVLKDGPKGTVGEAVEYWDDVSKQGGLTGAIGTGLKGLLELSGLPALERSAAELGARVGVGDSKMAIAKASGMVLFDSAIVIGNSLLVGKALGSLAKAAGVVTAEAEAAPTILRHYMSAESLERKMQRGTIYAATAGSSGLDKVYFLAEQGSNQGMNFLRRFNIGYLNPGQTAKAIEIDLAKLPPELAAKFQLEMTKGTLNLERFVTHQGTLHLKDLQGAMRVVDAQAMPITAEQVLTPVGAVSELLASAQDAGRGVQQAADAALTLDYPFPNRES